MGWFESMCTRASIDVVKLWDGLNQCASIDFEKLWDGLNQYARVQACVYFVSIGTIMIKKNKKNSSPKQKPV